MARPKRTFVTPLSAGRSVALGRSDPRIRRDNPARSVGVPDPLLTTDEVQALIDAAIAAIPPAEVPLAAVVEETTLAVDQGNAVFDGVDYLYVSFQDTVSTYTANRWYFNGAGETQNDEVSGTGTAPVTLVEFAAEAWPVPVP